MYVLVYQKDRSSFGLEREKFGRYSGPRAERVRPTVIDKEQSRIAQKRFGDVQDPLQSAGKRTGQKLAAVPQRRKPFKRPFDAGANFAPIFLNTQQPSSRFSKTVIWGNTARSCGCNRFPS